MLSVGVGYQIHYINKDFRYPYPTNGIVQAILDNNYVMVNGIKMHISDIYDGASVGFFHNKEMIDDWETIIEARMNELSELLKEVRSYK